ncbi:MAG: hypothetical protein HFE30_01240 [Clostridiales bacterium]|nr:hypothetical protein [Clostridiales bacterium]
MSRNIDVFENKQRRLFKKKRAGIVLTRDEVREIKKGRKKLRREMKARGIRSKAEFELTAGNLGLYFDKRRGLLGWLRLHWLGTLLGSLLAFLTVLFLFSIVQHMRGHFTIHLSDGMFKEGFTLSDNVDFTNPTTQLFANPAQGVPCISINQLPTDIDEIDGEHNDQYFAYTYYIRNEGENTVDFDWTLDLTSETQSVSEAVWVMLFCDGEMRFFAKQNRESGEREAIPSFGDNGRGYTNLPIKSLAENSDQFEVVKQDGQITYWRIVPDKFESPLRVTHGSQSEVNPMEVHKFTVVMWLEGDDIDTNDSVIGGHLGIEMNFKLISETEKELENGGAAADGSFRARWKSFWNSIWSNLTSR